MSIFSARSGGQYRGNRSDDDLNISGGLVSSPRSLCHKKQRACTAPVYRYPGPLGSGPSSALYSRSLPANNAQDSPLGDPSKRFSRNNNGHGVPGGSEVVQD